MSNYLTYNLNKDYTVMWISCKECNGTGFVELSEEQRIKNVIVSFAKIQQIGVIVVKMLNV